MKIPSLRGLFLAGAVCALALPAGAQVIELRATINATQVASPNTSNSAAKGTAVMLFDVSSSTFDLIVSLQDMPNAITRSQVRQAAAGANGESKADLGADAVYSRSGSIVTATLRNIAFTGDRLQLVRGRRLNVPVGRTLTLQGGVAGGAAEGERRPEVGSLVLT